MYGSIKSCAKVAKVYTFFQPLDTGNGIKTTRLPFNIIIPFVYNQGMNYFVLVVDNGFCLQQPLHSLDMSHLSCNPQRNISRLRQMMYQEVEDVVIIRLGLPQWWPDESLLQLQSKGSLHLYAPSC